MSQSEMHRSSCPSTLSIVLRMIMFFPDEDGQSKVGHKSFMGPIYFSPILLKTSSFQIVAICDLGFRELERSW